QFSPTQINRTAPPGYNPIDPIAEYTHSDGQAIIGGHVYRGVNIPELYGKYIFGELGRGSPSIGRLFYMDATQTTPGVDNTITTAPATVTLDGSKTVGFLRFNNALAYTITAGSGGTVTIDNGASGSGLVQVIRGSHTVNVPMTIAHNATLDVAAGSTLTLGGS